MTDLLYACLSILAFPLTIIIKVSTKSTLINYSILSRCNRTNTESYLSRANSIIRFSIIPHNITFEKRFSAHWFYSICNMRSFPGWFFKISHYRIIALLFNGCRQFLDAWNLYLALQRKGLLLNIFLASNEYLVTAVLIMWRSDCWRLRR